ncbi:MAG TPA: alpha-amylase family glycosyl hydrolase [Acidimicrobiales bacterium]|nr:alpha-amylase family glycosyl hydrolase [Acidimicrobiales bacterium]
MIFWLRVLAALTLIVPMACSGGDDAGRRSGASDTSALDPSGPRGGSAHDAGIPDPGATSAGSFLDLNGWMWFYTTADEISFAEITSMLGDLHDRGIRVVGVYAPYDGDTDKWLGAMARDFYDVAPQSGTVADFTALVDAAHGLGMKVVAYFGDVTVDRESEFFRTAEEQYAAGDRTSREVSAVHWADDDDGPLPTPATGPNEWKRSTVAGAYYWSLWGEVGFDLDLPGARAEVVRAERFWLDTGLDGFMWDAGLADPELEQVMVDLPATYTPNDKWLTFEATASEDADAYADFGLTSWFNLEDNDEDNDYSLVATGRSSPDDLEEGLAGAEEAHAAGKLTHAWSPFEDDAYADPRMRVQEAAVLAGGGIAYGAPTYTGYLAWPADVRADWDRVLVTVNANAALLPSATRTRVPAEIAGPSGSRAYALQATAKDGTQMALLVYNLTDEPATVTVDLAGTGIALDQTPVDLYRDRPAAPITAATYSLDLPPYGFALLDVTPADP